VAIGDHTVQVGASVGVCVARAGSCSIDALVEAADGALYDAKNNNTGSWRVVTL
jgi:predicted signal transduction protein with EAL and GGDEF domain